MNLSTGIIFLIGPGGVGKTTVGKILAAKLGYAFIDLDDVFMERLGDVETVIRGQGYEVYHQENSRVFFNTLKTLDRSTVFVLSSGFLTYNEGAHVEALSEHGVTILLLPSPSWEESLRVVIPRQLTRGVGLNEARETEKFTARFEHYQQYRDVCVFSSAAPERIAEEVIERLEMLES